MSKFCDKFSHNLPSLSVTQIHFKPATRLPPFAAGEGSKLGRAFVGKKEPTGSTENNDRWIPSKPDAPDHYTTYYKYKSVFSLEVFCELYC